MLVSVVKREDCRKLPSAAEEGMWRIAPWGWYELLQSGYWLSFAATVRTTPAAACGRGSPSLLKEESSVSDFRDRNWLGGEPLFWSTGPI